MRSLLEYVVSRGNKHKAEFPRSCNDKKEIISWLDGMDYVQIDDPLGDGDEVLMNHYRKTGEKCYILGDNWIMFYTGSARFLVRTSGGNDIHHSYVIDDIGITNDDTFNKIREIIEKYA